MTDDHITIDSSDIEAARDDRFHRFRLIQWWDQELLSRAKVLVVGAGALGNEIVKNLALLGVGNVFIADMDSIENSNLSRSVLFRGTDNGASKAKVAARAAKEIYPDMHVQAFCGNVVHDLGLGVYRWADLVIGGLDNREARLAINRSCWKVDRPWIDGGIEEIHGIARVFAPDGPCYECTMSELDWKLLQHRRSCNLLTRKEMEHGRSPTTPTISSIIAGVQCQEAVKLLHGLESIEGRGLMFVGMSTEAIQVEYQRKQECYSHDQLDEIIPLDIRSDEITVGDFCRHVYELLGNEVTIELGHDLIEKLTCPTCASEEPLFTSLTGVTSAQATCPKCQGVSREVVTFYKLTGSEEFADKTLRSIGVPIFDIVTARCHNRSVGLELSGDAADALGPILDDGVA